ncbi:S41 family peptidase [Niabella beijingensis]|uniref:S41 family peptidase n=1 Tax=Niabella beijingensis TaxID=2872700 RepID=UPI001CC0BF13|nr:S41 family peptidase [Niabella beijingensis]MBZ4188906.1 hypothetical protein [Niabella beijingensis]
MRSIFFVVILHSFIPITNAQPKYAKQQIIEDLKILKDIIIETNPILTKEQKDSIEGKLSQALRMFPADSASSVEMIKYFKSQNINTFYDDHANIILGEKALPTSAAFFPLPLYSIDSALLVNIENGPVPYGSIIESINGLPIAEIVGKLTKGNEQGSFGKYMLNTSFSFLFFLAYGAADKFDISYKDDIKNTKRNNETCKAITLTEALKMNSGAIFPLNRNNAQNQVNIQTQFDNNSKTYYLKLNSFGLSEGNDSSLAYLQFLSLFNKVFMDIRLKSAKTLILDIRGNPGGKMEIPGLLFSYLRDTVFNEVLYEKMPPMKNIPFKYLKTIDNNFIGSKSELRKRLYRLYDGFSENQSQANRIVIYKRKPNPYFFSGDTYLLVDGGTFSAAAYFAALFKVYKRGSIIGSPIGGPLNKITAGHLLQYELPNTKVVITVPLMLITFGKDNLVDEYITPDYLVPFQQEYQYFLFKKDWGKDINTIP